MPRSRTNLERQILRKSVGALARDRHPCADCGRTPLTGELVHVYDERGVICALCRPRRRRQPERTEVVLHCEHGHTVRLTARAA